MGKIALVFSGQGAQYSGMGKELSEVSKAASQVFEKADFLRPGTSAQCFGGTTEELSETRNTQPCMFAMELAAAAAVAESGIRPEMLAGFSLGEIAALTFSGAVSFEDGFRMVCRRGELMQEAAEKVDSGMYAVLKLDNSAVEVLCSLYPNVYPVNYNCPGQVTVAGLKNQLEGFKNDVKASGGRALPLKVGGGFHSPFMQEAAEELGGVLGGITISQPSVSLYSDYTGLPYSGDYRELLRLQVCNPVRWQDIVEHMIASGADTFIEVGPGRTLCGLIARISGDVRVLNVEDADSLRKTISEV